MKRGKLIIISGPSGVGKSTVTKRILKKMPYLYQITTCTTRKKRSGETGGKDYYFVSDEIFKRMIRNNEFLEWAFVHGKRYGTLRKEVERKLTRGKNCILEVDVQGALAIKKKMPRAISIFIRPKNINELILRIQARGKMPEKELRLRIKNADKEIAQSRRYDYVVINKQDKLEKAVKRAQDIIQKELKNID